MGKFQLKLQINVQGVIRGNSSGLSTYHILLDAKHIIKGIFTIFPVSDTLYNFGQLDAQEAIQRSCL